MTLWLSDLNTESTEPPSAMEGWLKTSTSITEKARRVCHQVTLQVLSEQWQKMDMPTAQNNRSTVGGNNIRPFQQDTFVREVLIFCDEKPAWYAQTLIPEGTYNCRKDQFSQLKNQPIGKILFNDPNIVREHVVYAYLTSQDPDYRQAMHYYLPPHLAGLWARKSIFLIDGKPLSIMEIFFPDALPAISDV